MAVIKRLYLRQNVTRYVMLFVERSGSTHLSTLLASHPDILALREELSQMRQRGSDAAQQMRWTREFFAPPLVGKYAARGFKTKIVDVLDAEAFRQILQASHCRIIQLQRRNLVKGAVSTINARRLHDATGNWNLLEKSDKQPPFEVDMAELDALLRQREEWDTELEDYVKRCALPTLQLWYEDILLDEKAVLKSLFGFLGVRPVPLEARTYKHTSDDLSETITNFSALRHYYAGTKYEAMLLDGITGTGVRAQGRIE